MGEVYRARDLTLKREVAIKVLQAYCAREPDRLRRSEFEAQSAAALNHPNIVSIFNLGEHAGAPYIVTDCCKARTCAIVSIAAQWGCMKCWTLEKRSLVAWRLPAVRELSTAISKPENLFLTKDVRAKILDFGLAKLTFVRSGYGREESQDLASCGAVPPNRLTSHVHKGRDIPGGMELTGRTIALPYWRTTDDLDKIVGTYPFGKCRPNFAGVYVHIFFNLPDRFIEWQAYFCSSEKALGNFFFTRFVQGNLSQEKCFGPM
jgi:serine/threonine protein kinase